MSVYGHFIDRCDHIQITAAGKQTEEMLEYLERRFARILLAIPNIYVFRVNEAQRLFSVKNMERQISLALEQDRIAVFYQPIYSVREQRFTSAEALV